MALPRLHAPDSVANPVYHCLSRIVDRRYILGPQEKEYFLENMRSYERLCGVRVLTHCVMDNHFHLLVEVPRRPEVLPDEAQLIGLIGESLGSEVAQRLTHQLERWREQNNEPAIRKELERWYAQMWDLGRFMKMVKQRFSCWYNRSRPERRVGTLWESRYRSILVECGQTLQAMAFYIDLNPVRAGMVVRPGDYRWSSYRANAQGRANALLVPHSAFELIAADVDERRRRYAEFIEQGIPAGDLAEIRGALQSQRRLAGGLMGSEPFRGAKGI